MKEGWRIKTISGLCDVIAGQSPAGKYYNSDGQGIPFYQGKKDFGDKYVKPPTCWTTQTTKIALEGDILMSVRAPVGPVNYATQEICIGRGLAAIRVRNVDRDFLFYHLLYLQPKIAGKEGAVFASINKSEIASLPISVPPLHEQQRIVATLDAAFADLAQAKANAEKNLANAKELFASDLTSLFADKNNRGSRNAKPLGILGKITSSKRIFKHEYTEQGVPFFRTKEIKELANGNPITTELFIADSKYMLIKSKFGVPNIGDLLISAIGTIGEIYVVDTTKPFYFKDGNVLWLKDFSGINSFYLKYALLAFVNQLKGLAHGSAYNALPIEKLKKYPIPIPPPFEQQRIVSRLDALSEHCKKLEAVYTQKLSLYDEMKQSLLHKAFSGEL